MGAELGATTSIFPYDESMGRYLRATRRGALAELADNNHDLLAADPEVLELARRDAERINRHLADTPWLRRAHRRCAPAVAGPRQLCDGRERDVDVTCIDETRAAEQFGSDWPSTRVGMPVRPATKAAGLDL